MKYCELMSATSPWGMDFCYVNLILNWKNNLVLKKVLIMTNRSTLRNFNMSIKSLN